MSRNEKRIRALAAELGIELESVTWEPIGMAMEMCGPSGGWRVVTTDGDDAMGYNIDELLKHMREHLLRHVAAGLALGHEEDL